MTSLESLSDLILGYQKVTLKVLAVCTIGPIRPCLRKLRSVNPFSHGASLPQLCGANAQDKGSNTNETGKALINYSILILYIHEERPCHLSFIGQLVQEVAWLEAAVLLLHPVWNSEVHLQRVQLRPASQRDPGSSHDGKLQA